MEEKTGHIKPSSPFVRTDLAIETSRAGEGEIKGVAFEEEESESSLVVTSRVEVINEDGERALTRERGNYVTISFPPLWQFENDENENENENGEKIVREVEDALTRELSAMVARLVPDGERRFFVAGLGNRTMTADSVGASCASRISVTRHAKFLSPEIFDSLGRCEVSALCPGVLSQTGIESSELVSCAVARSGANIVIAVDALAARSPDRLGCTIQLSDTGICPGSGVGNSRAELSVRTVGVPVIALGVPTVVDSSTLVADVLEKAGMTELDDSIIRVLERGRSFFVTLKDADSAFDCLSSVLARSIDSVTSVR